MSESAYRYTSAKFTNELELIPPSSERFRVYGDGPTLERARQWALRNEVYLAGGVAHCAHGLYGMPMCPAPANRCDAGEIFDHTEIWVPRQRGRHTESAFILTQPYYRHSEEDTRKIIGSYATSHGLDCTITTPEDPLQLDRWYGGNAIAVRLQIPSDWPLWPIEKLAILIEATQPYSWPDI